MKNKELAHKNLIKNGLPNNKNEKWHYTNLNNKLSYLVKNNFEALENINYKTAWITNDVDLNDYNHSSEVSNDVLKNINIAGFTGGSSFNLDKDVNVINLQNVINNPQHHIGLKVDVTNNITSTIIEKHIVKTGQLASSVTDISIDNNSVIYYIILNDNLSNIDQLQQFNATIKENTVLNLFLVNIGNENNLLRQEINVELVGETSDFNLRAINLLGEASHTDISMQINHKVANTTSREILRNIVLDKAFGAFQGLIKVNNLAQKTEAKMSCNTLILSDNASFSAKPELEIFADDVICGHGATVRPINEDLFFYLTSRGIAPNLAKALLIKAFISELLDDYENIISYLSPSIEGWITNFI